MQSVCHYSTYQGSQGQCQPSLGTIEEQAQRKDQSHESLRKKAKNQNIYDRLSKPQARNENSQYQANTNMVDQAQQRSSGSRNIGSRGGSGRALRKKALGSSTNQLA